ncbi:MAG: LCP family protein [Spirochaetia bacterium]|nr:LCP family protein [Spirochaetia bacterium]
MMKKIFDKSAILLWLIILLFAGLLLGGFLYIRSESLAAQIRTDKPISILLVFEMEKKPISSQLLMFFPAKSKAALVDIPTNMAVILKSIKRMDRVDYVYKPQNPKTYVQEIAAYLDTPIQGYLVFSEKNLVKQVDLLGGIQIFIPQMILQEGKDGIRLPGGYVTLDGDKALQYLKYRDPEETEADFLARRQKFSLMLMKRISQNANLLASKSGANSIVSAMNSNFSNPARKLLLAQMAKIDTDALLIQKITGMYRTVEDQQLFFPFYDGELVRDMLKQTMTAMISSDSTVSTKKSYTVEILNGTQEKGLANRTSDIFESFGYNVVSVGNAKTMDYDKTILIDRYGDKDALVAIGSVIKCDNFADSAAYTGSVKADFTIILGKDFNGRYCVRQ